MQIDRFFELFSQRLTALVAGVALTACANLGEPQPAIGNLSQAQATALVRPVVQAATSVLAGTNQRPYAEVIKDAERVDGYLPIYFKDDKYWLELKESDFDQPMFYAVQRTQGIGERRLWGGQMVASGVSTFRRMKDRVQWIEKNTRFVADGNKPMERAVEQGFSDSILAAAPIASLPHPTTKAILVDLTALVFSDVAATSMSLEQAFRQAYGLDRGNSEVLQVRGDKEETSIEVRMHFVAARLNTASTGIAGASVPRTLPDARSMLIGLHYSFSPLPEPMAVREADPRVGYFFTTKWNYRDDLAPSPRERFIMRWRLEKQDETAALSEPKKPIVFWIDRNVPERYRDAVKDGILMWNAAFERIGFKNAIQVAQQSDDAKFNTAERRYASVKWFLGTDNALAIGPSHADPRTGEILDADVVISDFWSRGARREMVRDLVSHMSAGHQHSEACDYAPNAIENMSFGMDALVARGDFQFGSEQAENFVQDTLRSVVAHEVGHALGLSHNFRASTAYTLAQLRDPAFVAKNGISASVMDYVPTHVGVKGDPKTAYVQKVLGPYDYWAIEYGYKQIAPGQEQAELARIAARGATDPYLAFGDDVDAGGESLSAGIDPTVSRFDLGSDAAAYFTHSLTTSRELWAWLASRPPLPDRYYGQQRGSVDRSLGQIATSAANLAKVIGGIQMSRNTTPASRSVFTPVPAAEQRNAMRTLTQGLFATDSFKLEPALLRRLVPDHLDRTGGETSWETRLEPNLPLVTYVLRVQTRVLDQLMSDRVMTRLLESEMLVDDKKSLFRLSELFDGLRGSIWQELKQDGETDMMRRNLQRAHLTRITQLLIRPTANTPADARSLARDQAHKLRAEIATALKRPKLAPETAAHLRESLTTLDESLHAAVLRQPS